MKPIESQLVIANKLTSLCRSLVPPFCAAGASIASTATPFINTVGSDGLVAVAAVIEKDVLRAAARTALRNLGVKTRPAVAASPGLWPEGTIGCATRRNGISLAIAAWRKDVRAIGIDLQQTECVSDEFWSNIFSDGELSWIVSQPEPDRLNRAAILLAAKEAFCKLQYPLTAQFLDFRDITIRIDGTSSFSVRLSLLSALRMRMFGAVTGVYFHNAQFTVAAAYLPQYQC